MIKFFIYLSSICILFNCKVVSLETDNSVPIQYYKAYDSISKFIENDKFLNEMNAEYGDDFVKLYIMKDIYIQNSENEFDLKNIYQKDGLLELSKKYSKGKFDQYKDIRQALPKELREYKGPNLFVYFSNIKNDTLKVDILTNPYSVYFKTGSVRKFLIVFDKDSIIIFNHWRDHYEW